MTNSGLDQTESIARQQNKYDSKIKVFVGKGTKNSGKREYTDCLHFLLFPQCFQKATSARLLKMAIV